MWFGSQLVAKTSTVLEKFMYYETFLNTQFIIVGWAHYLHTDHH